MKGIKLMGCFLIGAVIFMSLAAPMNATMNPGPSIDKCVLVDIEESKIQKPDMSIELRDTPYVPYEESITLRDEPYEYTETVSINNYEYSPIEYSYEYVPYTYQEYQREPMNLSEEEFDVLSRVVYMEMGGESYEAQLVIASCIYNAVASGLFGESVLDVVYRPNMFEVVDIGLWTVEPSELSKEVVNKVFVEGITTVKPSVMYFRKDYYHNWYGCTPEFQIGNVYFSSSWWVD